MTDQESSRDRKESTEPTTGSLFSQHWEETPEIEEVESYQSLSIPAVLALVGGLGALLIFFFPVVGTLLAIAAAILGLLGLRSIAQHPSILIGKWMAVAGLALAFLSASGAVTRYITYRQLLIDEARQFMAVWFEAARSDQPHVLEQLQYPYWQREVVTDEKELWKAFLTDENMFNRIEGITRDPIIRTLIALGERSEITLYAIDQVARRDADNFVKMTYAVTYPTDAGSKETFFLRVMAKRYRWEEKHAGGWALQSIDGPVLPEAFGGPLPSER